MTFVKKDKEATFSINISNLSTKLPFVEETKVIDVFDRVDVVEIVVLSLVVSSSIDLIRKVDGMEVVSSPAL